MILFGLIIFFVVKERYYKKVTDSHQEHISLGESFLWTLKCKPFRVLIIMGLAFQVGTSMVGSIGYYATVYWVAGGNTVTGNNWNGVMGLAYMIGGIIGIRAIGWVANHTGKRNASMIAMAFGLVAFAATWFLYNPAHPWLQPLASGSIAFTTAGLWMVYGSMGADIIDFDELNTGKRREGAFSSCGSWILKVGNSLGFVATGYVLTWLGFDSTKAAQSAHTLLGIRLVLGGVPILGLIIALLAFWRYNLTRERMTEIRTMLEKRRGVV